MRQDIIIIMRSGHKDTDTCYLVNFFRINTTSQSHYVTSRFVTSRYVTFGFIRSVLRVILREFSRRPSLFLFLRLFDR